MYKKYEAARKLLTRHTRNAVLNGRPAIHWLDGVRFSYERQVRGEEGIKNVKVTVDSLTGEEIEESITKKQQEIRYEAETGRKIESQIRAGEKEGENETEKLSFSPDQKMAVGYEDEDLILLDMKNGTKVHLTMDGIVGFEYGSYLDIYSQITVKREKIPKKPNVLWSPDGNYFVTYRADRRFCDRLYLIQSFEDEHGGLRPKLWEYPCPFVTDSDDKVPHYSLMICDVRAGKMMEVDAPDFLYPLFTEESRSFVKWMEDSHTFYFTWIERGFRKGRLYLCDAVSGRTKMLLEEKTDTFLNLGAFGLLDGYGSYLFSNFVTQDLQYVFWQSEKSGYAHLYRYKIDRIAPDFDSWSIKEPEDLFPDSLESLIVQKIVKVDENQKKIYFMANNVKECSDPLYYQLYVVGFEGGEPTRLTPEDAVHTVSMGEYAFTDTFSRVDLKPVTVLRNLDGELIRVLEEADISDLLSFGYEMPERFCVKAADGQTDIYGVLVRPAGFDSKKTYPVIDYVYGGAQLYNVPRDFTYDNTMDREVMGGLFEFAKLGFVGIIIDGRGTPGRGKAFHEYSYKNIHGCAGLADHVACAGQLKKLYPFLDMDRVGIWGNSGGGYATVTAMFQYPEFYKVGVASSGNYDQRMYEHYWTERYNGLYDEEVYRYGDITRLAMNLKGKLLLAYGAMDDNVSMSQTLRLCHELNRYNKDYELLVLPEKNHNVPSDLYFIRRKMDFFVKYLLGENPPKEFNLCEDIR